jgi:hypothetical protein
MPSNSSESNTPTPDWWEDAEHRMVVKATYEASRDAITHLIDAMEADDFSAYAESVFEFIRVGRTAAQWLEDR